MSRPAHTITLQKLLSRFHFGITLCAVALSGLTILIAGVAALRNYAHRNIELAAQLGAYGVEPALVFNDPTAARAGLEPLTRVPGIARLSVRGDRGQELTNWTSPTVDPSPLLTRLVFPQPVRVAVRRNGSEIGTVEVWGNSATLLSYVRVGLLSGLACLIITALGTVAIARRFEYELVKPLGEIANVARDVRLHRQFNRRVSTLGIMELDRLGGDINALLDELEGWQGNMESERAVLSHQARHDVLTALPNRAALDESLEHRIEIARKRGSQFALMFIDVDNFKGVNDSFGHATGDAVLVAISARLEDSMRSSDFAARLGGDEFVLLADPLKNVEQLPALVKRIRKRTAEPIDLPNGDRYQPAISIGTAIFPVDGQDATSLLAVADRAMYVDKDRRT